MPHLEHGDECLEDTYGQLVQATRWSYTFSRAVIIGGDVNTTMHPGPRPTTPLEFRAR